MTRSRLALSASFLPLLALLAGPGPARAASYTMNVDTTNDTLDINPGDGVCEDAEGYCSIRAAVMELNALGQGTINVPSGTYRLARTGTHEDAGLTGDLDISAEIHIVGTAGTSGPATVIQAVGDRALDITESGLDHQVSVSSVEFIDGDAGGFEGGAIRARVSGLTVVDCVFDGNQAHEGGAIDFDGVFLQTGGGLFEGNVADDGGAIVARGEFISYGTTYSGNEATGTNGRGGAVYIPSGWFQMIHTTMDNNIASLGGALHVVADPGLTLAHGASTMQLGSFIGNYATSGGAAWLEGTHRIEMEDMLFMSNEAPDGRGGGIHADAQLEIWRTAFVDNRSGTRGGALSWDGAYTGAELHVVSSTFAENETGQFGGAMAVNGGDVYVSNSTIAHNQATARAAHGGGIYHEGATDFRMTHTIVAHNAASTGLYMAFAGNDISTVATRVQSTGYNIVADAPVSAFMPSTGDFYGTPSSSPFIPLGTLGYHGYSTLTYDMGPAFITLDGGDVACTTPDGIAITRDQRGNPRPVGAACDIGAVER